MSPFFISLLHTIEEIIRKLDSYHGQLGLPDNMGQGFKTQSSNRQDRNLWFSQIFGLHTGANLLTLYQFVNLLTKAMSAQWTMTPTHLFEFLKIKDSLKLPESGCKIMPHPALLTDSLKSHVHEWEYFSKLDYENQGWYPNIFNV